MIMLYLFAFAIFALSLYGVVEMSEKHSWERKTCSGDRAKLAARQREDRRLLTKTIAFLPIVPLWLALKILKDLAIGLAELGWRRQRANHA